MARKEDRQRFIRQPEVQKLTGMSRVTIYRLARNNQFPKGIRLTPRATVWVESEVLAWVNSQIAQARAA